MTKAEIWTRPKKVEVWQVPERLWAVQVEGEQVGYAHTVSVRGDFWTDLDKPGRWACEAVKVEFVEMGEKTLCAIHCMDDAYVKKLKSA